MSKATSPAKSSSKSVIKNVTHHVILKNDEHCLNQIATRVLQNGDLVAVFNEERFPYHHDSGQTLFMRSRDGGKTWDRIPSRWRCPGPPPWAIGTAASASWPTAPC